MFISETHKRRYEFIEYRLTLVVGRVGRYLLNMVSAVSPTLDYKITNYLLEENYL